MDSPVANVPQDEQDSRPKKADEAREIFAYYKKVFNKGSGYVWNNTRGAKIRERLKRFSPEEMKRAIDNLAQSPFHNGQNDRGKLYNTLEFVFRNDTKTEEWVHRYDPPEDDSVRELGVILQENYEIYYERYLKRTPQVNKDDEQAFFSCAYKMCGMGMTDSHIPQAVLLAFFLLDWGVDKTPQQLYRRLDSTIGLAPIRRDQAKEFVMKVRAKKGKKGEVSMDDAIKLLETEGLFYD